MKLNWYMIKAGKLQKQKSPFTWPTGGQWHENEVWLDVEEAGMDGLQQFLAPLNLHPLQLRHCLDSDIDPGVLAFDNSLLMEYPAVFDRDSAEPAYLTIVLKASVLVTVRRGTMPALDDLIHGLSVEGAPPLHHLPQLIYQVLDHLSDMNVDAQIAVRNQIQEMARTLAETPQAINAKDLGLLRWQVGNLISLMENQLYCVSRLAASDVEALQEPHRKAYVQDLVSEVEISQRGAYRLEARVNDLYRDYQMVGSDRVEKRLRVLTIVSAITLPLGLAAGLLGMNVGGIPGTGVSAAFLIVVVLMAVIAAAQFWYFRWKGWFD